VLEKFKEFHALVERQSEKKLECIRTNNSGKYRGPFDVYCKQHAISHEKAPPKTPQLNGLVERMSRTFVERVRCILSEAKFPKHFWDETLHMAMHVINLSPIVELDSEVSDKICFGKDVKYGHLIVFRLCMFQRMKDPSWMQSQDTVSSLVMVRMNLVTCFMILLRTSFLQDPMGSSWKTLIRWRSLQPWKIVTWLM